jgi:hypothetical protein
LALVATAALAASALPKDWAGVYKHRFANGDVSGEHYKSEDILEIVPVDASAAYFRLHTEFFNGHICDISGVARQRGEALVYDGPKDVDGHPCRLHLAPAPGGISIYEDENGACRAQTCGARGGYGYKPDNPPEFTFAARREIRYLPRLLGSSEYKAALAEYRGAGGR